MIELEAVGNNKKKKAFDNLDEVMGLVESAPINIMYCDLDLIIRYVNPKSLDTLKQLKKFMPVDPEKMVGQSIDIFHKNPDYQKKLLANDRNLPHQALIQGNRFILS